MRIRMSSEKKNELWQMSKSDFEQLMSDVKLLQKTVEALDSRVKILESQVALSEGKLQKQVGFVLQNTATIARWVDGIAVKVGLPPKIGRKSDQTDSGKKNEATKVSDSISKLGMHSGSKS